MRSAGQKRIPLTKCAAVLHQIVHVDRTLLAHDVVQEPPSLVRPPRREGVILRGIRNHRYHPHDIRKPIQCGSVHEHPLSFRLTEGIPEGANAAVLVLDRAFHLEKPFAQPQSVRIRRRNEAF